MAARTSCSVSRVPASCFSCKEEDSRRHSETDTEIDPDSIKSIYSEELIVTESALAKNYRSYGARYHRKWVLSKGHSSVDRELQLLGVFLKKDSRNFTNGITGADGFLDTCASSPVTGFHLNSGIIPLILYFNEAVEVLIQPHGSQHAEMKSAEMISWGDENFHIGETHLQEPTQIKIFDQLRNSEVNESTASKWSAETIVNEIALFWELLSEINCKIGKLMLARLLTAHDAMMSYDKTPETCKTVHSEEVKELYSDLMTLDPPHSQYYKNEYSLVVLKQVNISSLLYYCVTSIRNLSLRHSLSLQGLSIIGRQ
ncbi:Geranylgeranyl transferase type-2 subunit alpha 1 [Camellia lanceoleosa]|uniref:Geranylgeranyl transferase type-2 subunit alpha 1 n=1 Tax=Camellia lanceoleosa TaxID=1840588 RepID=A0ACC0FYD1_9ERIC|nr:Geranylgeranyl transferase type-2 subunit alpha 1 [Camellia lanceoleosa]